MVGMCVEIEYEIMVIVDILDLKYGISLMVFFKIGAFLVVMFDFMVMVYDVS